MLPKAGLNPLESRFKGSQAFDTLYVLRALFYMQQGCRLQLCCISVYGCVVCLVMLRPCSSSLAVACVSMACVPVGACCGRE